MRRRKRGSELGQALVMVTLALLVIMGMMGLAVDFGWAFYVKRSAQAAADAAALAAVKRAMDAATGLSSFSCSGGTVSCASEPIPCPGATGNLADACAYAARNGFDPAQDDAVTVTVQASDRYSPPTVAGCTPLVYHPPTAPCVDTYYWVTVRVSRRIPQLFSAVLGNRYGTAAARATAAVAKAEVIGSLILLNRHNEPWSSGGRDLTGTNLYVSGTPHVQVPGGILLASNSATQPWAGWISGGGWVEAPFTYIRNSGWVSPEPNVPGSPWRTMVANQPDGSAFYDPMRGKGQPPLNDGQASLPYIGVPMGGGGNFVLDQTVCPGGVCPPGNYYAYEIDRRTGQRIATGAPITITGTITFGGSSFGEYVFFGGMRIGQGARVTFGPGRYVFAGVNTQYTDTVLDIDNRAWVTGGAGENSDLGRILILTDSSYDGMLAPVVGGLRQQVDVVAWSSLQFGKASLKSGNNDASRIQLYGLNPGLDESVAPGANPFTGTTLKDFAPAVIWQDQKNSTVRYDNSGNVDTSCGDLDNPCTNSLTNPSSPQLEIWASQYAKYGGYIYQPRGAWTVVQATDDYLGALQIVSGAVELQGSSNLTLTSPSVPITRWACALVE